MEDSRLGQGLRSVGLFILLVVLGDSAMTSVSGPDARKATYHFASIIKLPSEETTASTPRVEFYVVNPTTGIIRTP